MGPLKDVSRTAIEGKPATAASTRADPGWSPIHERVCTLYLEGELSTRQIAREVGIDRAVVTRLLHEAEVDVRPRGAGRARLSRRLQRPGDLACLLQELYVSQRLTSKEIGARLEMSERTVRDRLNEFGIPLRTRGWANREDRILLPIELVETMYLKEGLSAQEIAREFGTSRHIVLRLAHDHGWPVRLGGPPARRGPTEIELLEAMYADPDVVAALCRHHIPAVPPGGPIWQRFPVPIPLNYCLLRDLYIDCGLGTYHIELITGQPAMTVSHRLYSAGIPLRSPGGRSPFLRRWRRKQSADGRFWASR